MSLQEKYKNQWDSWYLDDVRVLYKYSRALARRIKAFKYFWNTFFVQEWVKNFQRHIPEGSIVIHPSFSVLEKIFRWRNHMGIISHGLCKEKGCLLVKIKRKTRFLHNSRLSAQKRRERFDNMWFEAVEGQDIKGKTIYLLDDVVSTGTTANSIAKILKNQGAERVVGVFLSRGG